MAAEQVVLPNGKTASLATTHTLTAANDPTVKSVPVAEKKAIVFFIGGAADQEKYYFQGAFHNIDDARNILDKRISAIKPLSKKYTSWPKSYILVATCQLLLIQRCLCLAPTILTMQQP